MIHLSFDTDLNSLQVYRYNRYRCTGKFTLYTMPGSYLSHTAWKLLHCRFYNVVLHTVDLNATWISSFFGINVWNIIALPSINSQFVWIVIWFTMQLKILWAIPICLHFHVYINLKWHLFFKILKNKYRYQNIHISLYLSAHKTLAAFGSVIYACVKCKYCNTSN